MPNQRNETQTKGGESRNTLSKDFDGKDKSKDKETLVGQAKSAAGDVYETVTDKATSTLEQQKAGLTGQLSGVAETVRRVSGTLQDTESDNPLSEYAARYTDTAAEKIDSIARYFDSADLKEVAKDLESYARRNPAVFLGSAFAIGIMAARFLKSSPPNRTETARTLPETGRGRTGARDDRGDRAVAASTPM